MHAYRFRISIEDQEDFLREIDLLANHTFEDFHHLLVASAGLDGKELASFFTCDHRWRKLREFTLIDMQANTVLDDDEDQRHRKTPIPMSMMSEKRIKDVINDPHQRLVFEYDFLNPKTFYIELVKIFTALSEDNLPRVFKSVGVLVKSPATTHFAFDEENEDFDPATMEPLDDEFTIEEDEPGYGNEPETTW